MEKDDKRKVPERRQKIANKTGRRYSMVCRQDWIKKMQDREKWNNLREAYVLQQTEE